MIRPLDKFWLAALVVVLAICGSLWSQWLVPEKQALISQRHDLLLLRADKSLPKRELSGESVPAHSNKITQGLTGASGLPDRLRGLHQLLGRNHLVLGNASYRLIPSASGDIGRYEIQIEVDGPYYGVRFFLRSLLASDPFVALQDIDLRRQASTDNAIGAVKAILRLVMYVKEENGPTQ